MSLTGGLDTRMIMAWQKATPGSLPCYTFGGMLSRLPGRTLSRQVAGMCGQSHQVIPAGKEFLERFPHYAARSVYLTDGCVEVNRAPDLYLNEIAREIAPVRMTGNYGGEVLRRVRTFKPVEPLQGLFTPEVLSAVHQADQTYESRSMGIPFHSLFSNRALGIITAYLRWSRHNCRCAPHSLTMIWFERYSARPESALTTNEDSLRLIADGNRESAPDSDGSRYLRQTGTPLRRRSPGFSRIPV